MSSGHPPLSLPPLITNVLVCDDVAKVVASVNVAVITCVPLANSGASITARPPRPTGAVPSVVVVPLKLSVNVTVPVALGGDTLAVRTEHSPAGTGVWKIAPTRAQANGGSSGIGGFN